MNKISSSFVVSKDVDDFVSSSSEEQIHLFVSGVYVSSLENEERVVLEICSPSERVILPVSLEPHLLYLLFYLPVIRDMGFFPLSPFSEEILRILTVALSQLFSNKWGYIRALKMVYKELDITSTVEIFFSFFTTNPSKGS